MFYMCHVCSPHPCQSEISQESLRCAIWFPCKDNPGKQLQHVENTLDEHTRFLPCLLDWLQPRYYRATFLLLIRLLALHHSAEMLSACSPWPSFVLFSFVWFFSLGVFSIFGFHSDMLIPVKVLFHHSSWSHKAASWTSCSGFFSVEIEVVYFDKSGILAS